MTSNPAAVRDLFRLNRAAVAMIAGYLLICLAVTLFGDRGCYQVGAPCAVEDDRYGGPLAFQLYDGKGFVSPHDPDLPYYDHPPLHSLIMLGTFFLAGGKTFVPILIVHILINVASGLLVRASVTQVAGRFGDIALAAYLFNPNVIAHANRISSDTVPALFIIAAIFLVLRYSRRPAMKTALLCGGLLGVATMIRSISTALMIILPIALPLVVVLAGSAGGWLRAFRDGVLASLLAFLVCLPWMLHMQANGFGFTMHNPAHLRLLLHDSLRFLGSKGPAVADGAYKLERMRIEDAHLAETVPNWESLSVGEKGRHRSRVAVDYVLSMPFEASQLAAALMHSWKRFLLSGGSGDINFRLGISEKSGERGVAFYASYAISHLYTFPARFLGLLGLIWLLRRRDYATALTLCVPILAVMATTVLVGLPRYRAAVEGPLAVLAVFGLILLVDLLRSRWARRSAPLPDG